MGTIGRAAHEFLGCLAEAGQSLWQMLPVGPVGYGNSPYSALSDRAGLPLLIDLEALIEEGLLPRGEMTGDTASVPGSEDRVDYAAAAAVKDRSLRAAYLAFRDGGGGRSASLARFRERSPWLGDFTLFAALKGRFGGAPWSSWPAPLRQRRPDALARAQDRLRSELDFQSFVQWVFDRQWRSLRRRARSLGVWLIGDLPFFLAHDSADVWAHQDLFRLRSTGIPKVVAGVPPDYFSSTGQRWGNPVYRWKEVKAQGFEFWTDRMAAGLERFDLLRLDHFLGFLRGWEVPYEDATAERGCYRPAPGHALFRAAKRRLGGLPFLAEDLGVVTEEAVELRQSLGLPGTRVLQFAFGRDAAARTFLPHNFERGTVVLPGTHDNDTSEGWFGETRAEASAGEQEGEREALRRYVGAMDSSVSWALLRLAWASVADLALVTLQDLLGLGTHARLNRPGTAEGNWEWRCPPGALTAPLLLRLRELTQTYGRLPSSVESAS